MSFIPAVLIRKKRDGGSLTKEEIQFFIHGYHVGEIPDYQMSALLMAITLRGLEKKEAAFLTESMLKSGNNWFLKTLHLLPWTNTALAELEIKPVFSSRPLWRLAECPCP